MTIQELTAAVQNFIGDAKTEEAFALLKKEIPTLYPQGMMDLTLLYGNFNKAHDDFAIRGFITNAEYDAHIAQTNSALLLFLDRIAHPQTAPSFTAKTDAEIPKSNTGKLLYSVPSKMALNKESRCVVRVAYDELTVTKDFVKTENTYIEDVRVAEVMNVELVDFNELPSFSIRSVTESEQFVEQADYTQWIFMVKALREGTYPLTIKVAIIEIINGKERKRDKVLEKEIFISANAEAVAATFTDANIIVQKRTTADNPVLASENAMPSADIAPPAPQKNAVRIETTSETAPPQKRKIVGITSAIALVIASVGGFFALNQKGDTNRTVASSEKTKHDTIIVIEKGNDSRRNEIADADVHRVNEEVRRNLPRPMSTTSSARNKTKADHFDANDEASSSAPVAIKIAPRTKLEKTDDHIILSVPNPMKKLEEKRDQIKSDAAKSIALTRVKIKNSEKFKDLKIFVDGEPATLIRDREGFITGFEFISSKVLQTIRFVKGKEFCVVDNYGAVSSQSEIEICNLK